MDGTERRRRSWRIRGALATVAVSCLGAGGWALTAVGEHAQADNPLPVAIREPSTTTTAPTTTTPPAAKTVKLPVPEPSPADPYAPTPDIVHGTLALPTIGVEQRFHEGVTLTAIDRGPSHWPGSAMPGRVGNVVVAGHRVTHSRPFYDLDLLRPGDPLVFTMNDGTTWTYQLVETTIVAPEDMHVVTQTPERTATLFACNPKGSARQRIVARFRLVPS